MGEMTMGGGAIQWAIYLLVLYAVAIVIYVAARIVRARQGIDLAAIHHEVPVE